MNTLIQKLKDARSQKEFVEASNKIIEAIHANPGEWVKLIETALKKNVPEAARTSEAFRHFIGIEDTIENKARLWDLYWDMTNNREFRSELRNLLSEAYYCSDSIPEGWVFS